MGKSVFAKRNGSGEVDLLFDLKLERMPDGVVRVYAPDRSGGLHVFQSECSEAECCDGCVVEAAFGAFDFAVREQLAKRGLFASQVSAVLRLNGVPFPVWEGV